MHKWQFLVSPYPKRFAKPRGEINSALFKDYFSKPGFIRFEGLLRFFCLNAEIGQCSSAAQTIRAEAFPLPNVLLSSNAPICARQTLTLTPQVSQLTLSFTQWQRPEDFTARGLTLARADAQPEMSGDYRYLTIATGGGAATFTLPVNYRHTGAL